MQRAMATGSIVAAFLGILSLAAVSAGPSILADSRLDEVSGGKPDCDTTGLYQVQCINNPANPAPCPATATYEMCSASVKGSNHDVCGAQSTSNACGDERCNERHSQTIGENCNDT